MEIINLLIMFAGLALCVYIWRLPEIIRARNENTAHKKQQEANHAQTTTTTEKDH